MSRRNRSKRQDFVQVFAAVLQLSTNVRLGARVAIAYGLAVHLERHARALSVAQLRKKTGWPTSTCRAALGQLRAQGWIDTDGRLRVSPSELGSEAHLQLRWERVRQHPHHPHDAIALRALSDARAAGRSSNWYLAAGSWLSGRLGCSVRAAQRTVERLARRGLVRVKQFVLGAPSMIQVISRALTPPPAEPPPPATGKNNTAPLARYGALSGAETTAEVERAIAAMLSDSPAASSR